MGSLGRYDNMSHLKLFLYVTLDDSRSHPKLCSSLSLLMVFRRSSGPFYHSPTAAHVPYGFSCITVIFRPKLRKDETAIKNRNPNEAGGNDRKPQPQGVWRAGTQTLLKYTPIRIIVWGRGVCLVKSENNTFEIGKF